MKELSLKNRYFLVPYFLFLLVLGCLLFLETKTNIHLYINSYHHPIFDFFFKYITFLGDGVFTISICVILLFINRIYSLFIIVPYLLSSTIVQIIKNFVLPEAMRPVKFFEGVQELYKVPGVENYFFNSFPSGHSTSIFSTCLTIAMLTSNNIIKSLLFCAAILVGFSRVYISQHFLGDVYAGSLIGTIISFFSFYLLTKFIKNKTPNPTI